MKLDDYRVVETCDQCGTPVFECNFKNFTKEHWSFGKTHTCRHTSTGKPGTESSKPRFSKRGKR